MSRQMDEAMRDPVLGLAVLKAALFMPKLVAIFPQGGATAADSIAVIASLRALERSIEVPGEADLMIEKVVEALISTLPQSAKIQFK